MALILVVVVIAALVAIATPFALSMRLHEKSARGFAARVKARRLAEGARNDAIAALMPTHPDEERRTRLARGDNDGDDEDWDSLDELSPRVRDTAGVFPLLTRSTTDTMTEVSVRDERSKIDLNGAPLEVISNLFGATVTTAELDYDATDILPVEDVRPFYSDGDPTTLDGVVIVNGEFIGYRDISTDPPALKGLVRGVNFSRQPPPDDPSAPRIRYPAGSLVQDWRGWKVAWDPIWRFAGVDGREGELARFETPSAIRRISDWDASTLGAAFFLQTNGVTFETLREWGIVQEKLDRSGVLESVDAKAAREKEDAAQRKRREDAYKGLLSVGVNPESIARFGGDRAVIRAWELLQGLEPDQQASLAKSMRERGEKLDSQQMQHASFWRGEVKRQLDEIIAMREKTPEVEAIGRIEFERIRPYITVDSVHEGEAWTDPQVVNHAVQYEPYQPFAVVRIQDGRRFRRGMVVRVRPIAPPGTNTTVPYGGMAEYRRVTAVQQVLDHTQLLLFPQLDRDYDPSTCEISGLLPKPINVNAAPREVLVACLTGLQTRLFQVASAGGTVAPNFVTPTEAAAIADRILAQPLHCHQDLKALLDKAVTDNVIQQGDAEAILQSAIDPANPLLSHAGLPFVYSSGDVYEVTATGIVNDEAANEIARVKTREIAQVAPPRDLVWTLDSQVAFQERVGNNAGLTNKNDPRSFSPAYTRGVWSHLFETFPQDCLAMPWLFPQRTHLGSSSPPTEVKLSTWRDYDQPAVKVVPWGTNGWAQGVVFSNHFDMEREGHKLAQDVSVTPQQESTRQVTLEDGTPRLYLGPGSVRAWFRADNMTGPHLACAFDAGVEDGRDRLTLGYDLDKKELVATIHDESLDMLESGGNPRPNAKIAFPTTLKPQNWYHLGLAWKGSDRGDLGMTLDGKPVGTDQTGTKTTALIDATSLAIPVVSTAGFPNTGYIRVGGFWHPDGTLAYDTYTYQWSTPPWSTWQYYGEVLYYSSKTETQFNIAPAPNPWGVAWLARHYTDPTQPAPTPPEGSTDPTRVPLRGTGRYSEEPDPGYTPLPVRRGSAHDIGTPVTLWGYTLFLKNGPNWPTRYTGNPAQALPPKLPAYSETLHQGQATLLDPLPQNTPVTLIYKPNPPGWVKNGSPKQARPVVVQPTDTEIPVVWAGHYPDAGTITGGWPASGYLRIGNERLYYSQITQVAGGVPAFIVQRGLDGTVPTAHYLWEPVVLESIRVTSTQDYPQRESLVQPEVFVQLTTPQTAGTLQAALAPTTPCSVEWVSVLPAVGPAPLQTFIIPAVRRDQPIVQQQGGLPVAGGLLPTPEAPRFIPIPVSNQGFTDLRLSGDNRWIAVMETMFNTQNGTLGPNPGNTPVIVLPQQPPPPPKPGQPVRPAAPLLPGATKPLKEWLKAMEGNHSRGLKGTANTPLWSAANPTSTSAGGGRQHVAGEKVLPTFILGCEFRSNGRGCEYIGPGDVVTLADDTEQARDEHTVLWTAGTDAGTNDLPGGPSLTGDSGTGVLVALDDFAQRQYLGGNRARVVRFPSGQLPHGPPAMMLGAPSVKTGTSGPIQGYVDEVIATQENEPSWFEDNLRSNHASWPQIPFLDPGATTYGTCLQPSTGLTQQLRGGLIFKLEDEILGVNDVDAGGALGQGMKVVRGVLGTLPAPHGPESSFWWGFPLPRVGVAEYGFSVPYGDQIAIRQRPSGAIHDTDFYAALDRGQGNGPVELLPLKTQRGNFLLRPRDRFDRGTFRGSFGTAVESPDPLPGDLLFDWPARYFDRYQPLVSSLEGAFLEVTKELKGAYFESVTWDAVAPNPYTRLLVAVRIDGAPSWDAVPAKEEDVGTPGKLYLFEDPKKENKILVRGDRIEVRVYMTYKPRAFFLDGWKQSPDLKQIKVTYRQPTRVRRREEMLE
jgi:hypothetical protein